MNEDKQGDDSEDEEKQRQKTTHTSHNTTNIIQGVVLLQTFGKRGRAAGIGAGRQGGLLRGHQDAGAAGDR